MKQQIQQQITAIENEYSVKTCFYHYLHMAKRNYREFLKGDTVWLKKYLYVLRPVLALQWMEQSTKVVPVRFDDLLETILPSGETRRAIDQLLVMKKQGMEAKHGPAIPAINIFLNAELLRLESLVGEQGKCTDFY
ncbi:MAG: nucleotidyltransferase domain-containing protein [Thermodesulfobacteriota bacterium]|nr:nucleotidyltransferase domain-containing protein [Thermodesulfobacteriota bacterium]